ncbi:UNVERIFIED_CONTAM: hypothetical protein FKN15_033316 [Acipenser sinensis]
MATKSHPPLMKKHSQSDLVSRLKTRKILGVGGEDDDGEVHRSKGLVGCVRSDAYRLGFNVTTSYKQLLLSLTAVTAITLVENGTVSNKALVLVFSRVVFVGISLCYYYQLGRRSKKI